MIKGEVGGVELAITWIRNTSEMDRLRVEGGSDKSFFGQITVSISLTTRSTGHCIHFRSDLNNLEINTSPFRLRMKLSTGVHSIQMTISETRVSD